MPRNPLPHVRKLALSLPEAHEVEAWGEPTFRVKNKIFAMYAHANNHHGGGRPAGASQGRVARSHTNAATWGATPYANSSTPRTVTRCDTSGSGEGAESPITIALSRMDFASSRSSLLRA